MGLGRPGIGMDANLGREGTARVRPRRKEPGLAPEEGLQEQAGARALVWRRAGQPGLLVLVISLLRGSCPVMMKMGYLACGRKALMVHHCEVDQAQELLPQQEGEQDRGDQLGSQEPRQPGEGSPGG